MPVEERPGQTKMAQDVRAYLPANELHFAGSSSGLECYFIPAPIGLRPDSYDAARRFLQELVVYFTTRLGCSHEGFLQIGRVRDETAVRLFTDNARKWIPETGLGIWPHRSAPRMWKMEDVEEIDTDTEMPLLLHSVFRLTADANARLDAMTTMAGTGCGVQLVSRIEGVALLRNLRELFLGFIQDRVFRIFPWYVPLMEKAVLAEPMEALAVDAMRGVTLYIRESPEDGGILIASAEPLAEVLALIGCKQVASQPALQWKLGDGTDALCN